ncbi:2-amino-4-hydroxy-6-hydroxymethyldihydropteridine diphosphokinase [Kineothrix sedimenti]|uniref:Bifunctional folate synthesis protein n=1 Tax=Kineothrix sedimenti TaxID=3123317 RepID=A0ABZ3ESV1_9FIRM
MENRSYDIIKIENLEVFAHHGVYSQETAEGQNFYINAALYVNTRGAGQADNLELSVNYGEVCHFMNDYMKNHTYKLIEAAAEHLAEAVLLSFPLLRQIELEIRKPHAPIGLPFESVSVKIRRGWHTVYLALGSSVGKREEYISGAIESMGEEAKIRVKRVSDIIRTAPYGGAAKEEFLNGALKAETLFTPEELLDYLHMLEENAGRERTIHWGDRTLDVDIIFYDDIVMSTDSLTIPHKDMQNRDFVLIPLIQIDPYILHPLLHKTVSSLLKALPK